MKGGQGTEIQSGGMTMAGLGRSVQSVTGRIIVDRTGLEGYYAFTLRYRRSNATPDSDPPVLFTALQEQLGLKLQSATGPVRVLVIDRLERPTEN
ncbi:MAG TPA: TIGR03435 family protein [Vicinamibacterales bacterium]|nr:TIGR03435 family protein [Vicinamibacterales bacterium]